MLKRNHVIEIVVRIFIAILTVLPLIFIMVVNVFADNAPDPIPPTLTPTNPPTPTLTKYPCPVATYDSSKQVSFDYAMICGHCIPTATAQPWFDNPIVIPTIGEYETPTPGSTATPGATITPGGLTATPTITAQPSGPVWYVSEAYVETIYSSAWHRYTGQCNGDDVSKLTFSYHYANTTERFFSFGGNLYGSGKPAGYMMGWQNNEANPLGTSYTSDEVYTFLQSVAIQQGIYLPSNPVWAWRVGGMQSFGTITLNYQDYGGQQLTLCYGDNPPEPEPTPTSTPTPTAEPGICSNYDYQDYDPIAGWGGFVTIDTNQCHDIIPEIDLTVGAVELITGDPFALYFPGFRLCYRAVVFGDIQIFGLEIPIDLIVLPFAAMLIRMIMNL